MIRLRVGIPRAEIVPPEINDRGSALPQHHFRRRGVRFARLIVASIGEARFKQGRGSHYPRMRAGDVVSGDARVPGVADGAGSAGVLIIQPRKTVRVVANAQALRVGHIPIALAHINVVVQAAVVGGEILSHQGQARLRCGVGGSGRAGDYCDRLLIALAVVIEEEEQFVLDHRAAEVSAELIEVIILLREAGPIVLPAIGVEALVAEELEKRPMKVVSAALGDHVQNAPAGAPDLRRVAVGGNLILLHGILAETIRAAARSGASGGLPEERIIGVRAVHLKAIRCAALSTEGEITATRRIDHHTRRRGHDIEDVAAFNRQLLG